MSKGTKIMMAMMIVMLVFILTFAGAVLGSMKGRDNIEIAILQARKEDLLTHERNTLQLMAQLNDTMVLQQAKIDELNKIISNSSSGSLTAEQAAIAEKYKSVSIPPLPTPPANNVPSTVSGGSYNPPPARTPPPVTRAS